MNRQDLERLTARLPSRPGIHTRERHPEFVIFIPFVQRAGGLHLLFEKRAAGIRQGGEICFPGGRHEPNADATIEDTALRETEEELGVPRSQLEILGRLDTLIAHWGGFIHVCLGTIDADARFAPNRDEVERVISAPFSYFEENPAEEYKVRVETQPAYVDEQGETHVLFPARELGLPSRYWQPWGVRMHPIYVYRFDGEVIWGITAELVRSVVELARSDRHPSRAPEARVHPPDP